MPQKTNWTLILVLIGAGLLGLSWYLSKQVAQNTVGLKVLAKIESNGGKIEIFRREMKSKEVLKKSARLYSLDSVETAADGMATLEFESGDRIRIIENSQILLDEEAGQTVLWIKNGDIHVENQGAPGALVISKNGKRFTPTQYEYSDKNKGFESNPPSLGEQPKERKLPKDNTLSADSIRDTLQKHKNIFFRCYTQLLQRTPGVAGEATISFTIERTGKTSQANIASSSLYDPAFKRCLIDGIARVEFKSFSGDPITTVFPLKFE